MLVVLQGPASKTLAVSLSYIILAKLFSMRYLLMLFPPPHAVPTTPCCYHHPLVRLRSRDSDSDGVTFHGLLDSTQTQDSQIHASNHARPRPFSLLILVG